MRTATLFALHLAIVTVLALLGVASGEEPLWLPAVTDNPDVAANLPWVHCETPDNSSGWVKPPGMRPATAVFSDPPSPEVDDLLQRLQAAERRISELERSSESTDHSEDTSKPGFTDELKEQLGELWKTHQASKTSDRPTVKVFGRMHLEALAFPSQSPGIAYFENPTTGTEAEDRLQFRRIRIGAQGNILKNGVYRVEFDFGNPSRSTFRDTYIGFEELPFLQTLLIGNQKRPLGLDSWSSNQHVIFFERPLAINAFNPNYRRIGIQTYGHSVDENLNWQLGVFELEDVKEIGSDLNDPIHFSFNTRISGTPWYDEESDGRGYLHLGVSNMYATTAAALSASGNNGDLARFSVKPEMQTSSIWIDTGTILGATSFNVTGLEMVLNVGSLQLQGEYLTTFVNRNGNSDLHFDGGYAQAAYFLTGEHERWDRETGQLARPIPLENFVLVNTCDHDVDRGWGAWQIAARWSYLSLSDKDILGGRQENMTLGLNWYWTPYSKLMFNLVSGRIWDRAPVSGFSAGHFVGLGTRVMMDF